MGNIIKSIEAIAENVKALIEKPKREKMFAVTETREFTRQVSVAQLEAQTTEIDNQISCLQKQKMDIEEQIAALNAILDEK